MKLMDKDAQTGQHSGKINIIMFILLVTAIIAVAFLVYAKSQNADLKSFNIGKLLNSTFAGARKSAASKLLYEIKYDKEEHAVFGVYKDYIIKCTKDNIKCFNAKGEPLWSKPVSINNPLIKAAGNYLLIADVGGKDVYVINGRDIKWNEKLDNNIINADINEQGYAAVVKEVKGYKGGAMIYDPQGNWIFTVTRGESFILSAKVMPSDNKVLLNTVDTSGISANSNLEFIDMNGSPISSIKKEDEIFPSLWYLKDNSILAVSDTLVTCIDSSGQEKWKQQFSKIYSSNTVSGKYTVVGISKEDKPGIFNNDTEIQIIGARGQPADTYTIEGRVVNIETYGGVIAANTGSDVYFLNTRGKLIGKYSSHTDISRVFFFNKDQAALITTDSIKIVKID